MRDDEEIPEWEMEDEEIPPSLQKRWDKDAKMGRRARVCPKCKTAYTDEDLTCRGCGRLAEFPTDPRPHIARFFKSVWGALIAVVVLLGFFLDVVLSHCERPKVAKQSGAEIASSGLRPSSQ